MIMSDDLELANKKCLQFFEIYGSHFYLCSFTFGGVFIIGSTCKENCSKNDQTHKMRVSELFKSILSGNTIKEDSSESRFNLHFSHEGGDDEQCNTEKFYPWKSCLKVNKKSWTVIDRVKLESGNPFGVWKLVKMHHRQFINAKKLSTLLSACWLKKVKSEQSFLENDVRNSKQTINDILFEMNQDITGEGCEDQKLLAIGRDLLTKFDVYQSRFGERFMYELDLSGNKIFEKLLIQIMKQKGSRACTCLLLKFFSFCERLNTLSSHQQDERGDDTALLTISRNYFRMDNYGFDGYLSSREVTSVDELLSVLDNELLPDLAVVSFCPTEILHNVDLATKLNEDIRISVEKLFKILTAKKEFTQCMLLCVVGLSMGLDLSTKSSNELRKALLTGGLHKTLVIGKKILQDFQKNISEGTLRNQAWLLLQLIFLCDSERKKVELFHYFWIESKCCFTDQISRYLEVISADEEDKMYKHTNDLISICGLRLVSEDIELPHISYLQKEEKGIFTKSNKNLSKILKAIEFEKYFTGKLTIEDVLKIRDTMFDKPKQLSDIPWAILRTIISIDYSFRDDLLNDFFKKTNDQASKALSHVQDSKKSRTTKKISKLHPSDVLFAIFLCCDPFLKRLLARKMFVCKIAIPFIFPDFTTGKTFISLWNLRDIFLEGSPESVVTKNLKSVSFVRIGDVSYQSKSDLINKLIREHDHRTFFHKDCPLGNMKRSVSNGIIEVTWYIPKKTSKNRSTKMGTYSETNEEKTMEEALTIFNLRGDAAKHENLIDILLHLSNIIIVFVSGEYLHGNSEFQSLLKKIHQSNSHVIIITDLMFEDKVESDLSTDSDESDASEVSEKEFTQKEYLNEEQFKTDYHREMKSRNPISLCSIRQKNLTELKEYLTQKIIELCLRVESNSCLEDQILLLPFKGLTREENHHYNTGRVFANHVLTDLHILAQNQEENIHTKAFVLPLQCRTLWPLWSQLQKEENRNGKKGKYDTDEKHKHRMRNIRAWQVLSFGRKTDVMTRFVRTLDKVLESKEVATFFLACLNEKLDYQSRTILPTLASVLCEKFTEYERLRSIETTDDEFLDKMRGEIYIAEKNLAHASFGLEHFFREIGQVYESFMTFECKTGDSKCNMISRLPKIAAKLLTMGQPLEIMDGDAANIPLVWIKSVFGEINALFHSEKKLIAISVLGIQSSGKSTLLNTMFGLQFAVSAGRCTRGIFLQLVPVDREKSTLPFDYALIIDTEGLRAPELAGEKMHHDNELATFVIGLADVAIINIKGETIAEMEDVLQIVVHALIRLKHANEEISLHQTCIFVHQNVSAQNADKETFQGSQKTVQNLDNMTSEAAEEEKMANIKCFKDVIQFDPIHHIFQIPDLWHGSPPMAPASKDYSEKAVDVLRSTLYDIAGKRHSFLRFSEISEHLVSLWKGILSEDFVFSFRNVLEVKAYNILEKKFQSLCWSLEELKMKYLQDKIKPKIGNCSCQEEINQQTSELKETFQNLLNMETSNCVKELGTFFENADLSEYMVHWRGRKENELRSTSKEIVSNINKKLDVEVEKCASLFRTKNNLTHIRKTLTTEAMELAKNARGDELLENELMKRFEDHWLKWLDEYAPDNTKLIISEKISQMKSELILVLYEKFSTHSALLETRLSSVDISYLLKHETMLTDTINISDIEKNCISVCGIWNSIKKVFTSKTLNDLKGPTVNVIQRIFKKVEDYLRLTSAAEYDHTQFSKALKYLIDDINEHNSNKEKHGFTITPFLEIEVAVKTAGYSFHRFAEMIANCEKRNSIRTKMDEMKEEIIEMFNDVYKAKADEILVTNILCNALKPIIMERTSRRFTVDVVSNITMGHFQNMKFPLIKEIMITLAEESDFDRFMKYISNSENFAVEWIKEFTIKKYKRNEKDMQETVFDSSIKCFLNHAIKDIKEIFSLCLNEPNSFCDWVDQFEKNLKTREFIISSNPFEAAKGFQIKDFKDFVTNIQMKLESVERDMREEFQKEGIDKFNWGTSSPFQDIKEILWKCNAVCPLCNEPCTVASPTDDHACIQHRSQGVSGRSWAHSNKLTFEACSYLITNANYGGLCGSWCKCSFKFPIYHPFVEYAKYMPNWRISPSPDCSAPKYWAWFMASFQDKLAEHYGKKQAYIPFSFKLISKEEAIASLHVYDHA